MIRARSLLLAAGSALAAGFVVRHLRTKRRRAVLADTLDVDAREARHAAKLERIAQQLREHAARSPRAPVSLRKAAPPHQVPKFADLRRDDHKVDVSDLTDIIAVDPSLRTCTAESGAMFCDVVAATLRHGLIPAVVPELKTITVGGAVTGCSIESMSWRYGGFHDSCLEYEVITAEGEVLTCAPRTLLFEMMQSSFGTLGILSKLTFRLVPAKRFVRLVYERYPSVEAMTHAVEHHAFARDVEMMDAIAHGPHEMILATGHFVDDAPYTHAYDWMRVYYESTHTRSEDYLRTEDYLFRYDRGVTSVHPRSFLGRLLLGKLLDSGTALRLADVLHGLVLSKDHPTVTLDVFLPMSRVAEFMTWYREQIGHFPLWCVPYKRVRDYEWLNDSFYAGMNDQLFLDIAIYGLEQADERNLYRMIEEKLIELGGMKTLISHNYYSPEEFWHIFNKPNYDKIKAITDPNNRFRDLYTKTCLTAMGRQ